MNKIKKNAPKNLLKAVLNRKMPAMSIKACALNVLVYTIAFEKVQPDHDKILMEEFKAWIRKMEPPPVQLSMAFGNAAEVTEMIEENVNSLLELLKMQDPGHAAKLNDILWRQLFDLPEVAIVVTAADDSNDSGSVV